MDLQDAETRIRWINEDARNLYDALNTQLHDAQHKRAVALGQSMEDGDDKTAMALLKQNRALRLSQEYRDEVWASWQSVIDPIVKRMTELRSTFTVPEMIIKK